MLECLASNDLLECEPFRTQPCTSDAQLRFIVPPVISLERVSVVYQTYGIGRALLHCSSDTSDGAPRSPVLCIDFLRYEGQKTRSRNEQRHADTSIWSPCQNHARTGI